MRVLWDAAFPEEELRGLVSEQCKEMGWQGRDRSTDFRYSSISIVFLLALFDTSTLSLSLGARSHVSGCF